MVSLQHALLLPHVRHMVSTSHIHSILPHHLVILLMILRIEVLEPERLIPKSRHPQIKVLLEIDMCLRTWRLISISALSSP